MRSPNFFWGIIIILVGLLLLGSNLGYLSAIDWTELWRLWPVLLIIIGIRQLAKNELVAGLLSLIVVIIGLTGLVFDRDVLNRGRMPNSWFSFESFSGGPVNEESAEFNSDINVSGLEVLVIELGGNYEVQLSGEATDKVSVLLEGPKSIVNNLSFSPNGAKLTLREKAATPKPTFSWLRQKVTGTIRLPKNMALELDLSGLNKIEARNLDGKLSVIGAGAADIDFSSSVAIDPSINLSGAGKVNLDSCSGKAKIKASGATKLLAKSCRLESLSIESSGAAEVRIDSGTIIDLDARSSGAAKIRLPKPAGQNDLETTGAAKVEFVEE